MSFLFSLALSPLLPLVADTSFAHKQGVGITDLLPKVMDKFTKLVKEADRSFTRVRNVHPQIKFGNDVDPLYDPSEAATYLGIKESTLAAWRCLGRYDIEYVKVGRLVKYRKSALDAFLERRTRSQVG